MTPEQVGALAMVDTLGTRVPAVDTTKFPHKYITLTLPGEEHRWTKRPPGNHQGREGLQITAIKTANACDIEGTVAMHHQMHNIVSSNDVALLAFASIRAVNQEFGLGLGYDRAAEFARGRGMQVTRIDVPVLLGKPPEQETAAIINGLAIAAIAAGVSASVYRAQTVYFDQNHQLRSLKVYDKAAQMAKKRKKPNIPQTPATEQLMALTKSTLRLEAVFRKKWITRKFTDCSPSSFTPETLGWMLLDLLEKYDLRRDLKKGLSTEDFWKIPERFRKPLMAWQTGRGSRDTLEHRAAQGYLLEKYKLDIDGPSPRDLLWSYRVGDFLTPNNFLPVPDEIRSDSRLFFVRDMEATREAMDRLAVDALQPTASVADAGNTQ